MSRLAIVGVSFFPITVLLLVVVLFMLSLVAPRDAISDELSGFQFLFVVASTLAVLALSGAAICVTALVQIKRSGGRLRGLWLAYLGCVPVVLTLPLPFLIL